MRQTKIVATLGPATTQPEVLRALLSAGVDVVRLNCSHGSATELRERAAAVRAIAHELQRDVALLLDLQGPKIRIERFNNGGVTLAEGAAFTIDTALAETAGDITQVGCAYKELADDLTPGDTLLLADGLIAMQVEKVAGTQVHCRVTLGGELGDRKGLNKLGGGLSASALTEKDRADIQLAAELQADYMAVSFPRSGADIRQARQLLQAAGGSAGIIAKIERAEAIAELADILDSSDAVMVARGDLGIEIGYAELPGVQKRIIRDARERNRMVITATQMMESMTHNPVPTRAEVLDVANAVMDGSDAVMLSGETALGKYPVKTVQSMHEVCIAAERQHIRRRSSALRTAHFEQTDEAIAMAATYTALNMHARAILALTESGATAIRMSCQSTAIPIYALTRHEATRRRLALCRGVTPIAFAPTSLDAITAVDEAIACLRVDGLLQRGDRVLVTKGDFKGIGGTNALKIATVEDHPEPAHQRP